MALASGTKLGHYEILSPIGAGSMGEVYRARDTQLDRDVAIKVLPEFVSTDRDRLLRFEREAKSAAALNHPNILAVYQMGSYLGMPYLVSELLEGKTLTDHAARSLTAAQSHRLRCADRSRPWRGARKRNRPSRSKARQPLRHQRWSRQDPRLRPGEADATKAIDRECCSHDHVARHGARNGRYMAPEQVRGLNTDQRADIFALGAILYELVTGQQSFQRPTSADTMSAILNEELPAIGQRSPETPAALERVIRRCLEKDPAQRFQSASDLAFALEALSDPTLSFA